MANAQEDMRIKLLINRIVRHVSLFVIGLVGIAGTLGILYLIGRIFVKDAIPFTCLAGVFIGGCTFVVVMLVWFAGYACQHLFSSVRRKALIANKPTLNQWVSRLNGRQKDDIFYSILGKDHLLPTLLNLHPRLDEYIHQYFSGRDLTTKRKK